MKDYYTRRKGLLFYLWNIGYLLLSTSYVTCYDEVCPPGQDGVLDRHAIEKVLAWMPEEFKNPDDICVSHLGKGSFLCRDNYGGNFSSICSELWCKHPVLDTCTALASNDGIHCGDQKWCYDGVCRYSQLASNIQESCPFGDSGGFSLGGLSCAQLVSRDRKMCYDDVLDQICCGSCKATSLDIEGCMYGDRVDGCVQEECFLMTTDQLVQCCQTCGYPIDVVPSKKPEVTQSSSASVSISTTRRSISTPLASGTTFKHTTSLRHGTTTTQGKPPSSTRLQQTQTTSTTENPTNGQQQTTSSGQTTNNRPNGSTDTAAVTRSSRRSATVTTPVTIPATTSATTLHSSLPSTEQRPGIVTTTASREVTFESSTAPNNVFGETDTQQATRNAIIGAGVGVGALVVIAVVIVTVYIIKKKVLTTSKTINSQRGRQYEDNRSEGGDSTTSMTANMMRASSTWYPNYLSTHTME